MEYLTHQVPSNQIVYGVLGSYVRLLFSKVCYNLHVNYRDVV